MKSERPFILDLAEENRQLEESMPRLTDLLTRREKATNEYNAAMMTVLQAEDAADKKLKALSEAQGAIDEWYAARDKISPKGSKWGKE